MSGICVPHPIQSEGGPSSVQSQRMALDPQSKRSHFLTGSASSRASHPARTLTPQLPRHHRTTVPAPRGQDGPRAAKAREAPRAVCHLGVVPRRRHVLVWVDIVSLHPLDLACSRWRSHRDGRVGHVCLAVSDVHGLSCHAFHRTIFGYRGIPWTAGSTWTERRGRASCGPHQLGRVSPERTTISGSEDRDSADHCRFNYIIDVYLWAAASALAGATVARSACGAAFPLFATQMYAKLGTQWASSLLGFLALLMA